MKFYFCEKCGKRVTDEDISGGDAKNKKLRGVYCESCSVGVMTLETVPLNDEEAKKILKEQSTPARKKGIRRSSGNLASVPRADRAPPKTSIPKNPSSRQAAPETSRKTLIFSALGVAFALLLVVGVALLGAKSGSTTKRPASKSSAQKSAPPSLPKGDLKKQVQVPVTDSEDPKPKPQDTSTQSSGASAVAQTEPAPKDTASKVNSLESPGPGNEQTQRLPAPSDPNTTAQEPEKKDADPESPTGKTTASSSPEEPDSEKKAVGAEKPPPKVVLPDAHPVLLAVLRALNREGLTAARQILEAEKKELPEARPAIKAALDWQEKQAHAFLKILQGKQGKNVSLLTAKGKVKGELQKIEAGKIWIGKKYRINGAWKQGPARGILFTDLTRECRINFMPASANETPEIHFARALEGAAAGDLEAATKHLEACGDYPGAKALKSALKEVRAEALEIAADQTWGQITKEAEACSTSSQAKKLIERIGAFEKSYLSTQFAKSEGQIASRLDWKTKLEELALGLDPRVLKLFNGEIKDYDPKTGVLEIHYDLKNLSHRKDFQYVLRGRTRKESPRNGVVEESEGLRLASSTFFSEILHLPQFAAGAITVSVRYKGIRKKHDGYRVGCMFGMKDAEGESPRLAAQVRGGADGASIAGVVTFKHWSGQPARKEVSLAEMPPESGTLEYSCQKNHYLIKLDGSTLLEYSAPEANDRRGISLVAGQSFGYLISKIQVKGRLDPRWLRKVLRE